MATERRSRSYRWNSRWHGPGCCWFVSLPWGRLVPSNQPSPTSGHPFDTVKGLVVFIPQPTIKHRPPSPFPCKSTTASLRPGRVQTIQGTLGLPYPNSASGRSELLPSTFAGLKRSAHRSMCWHTQGARIVQGAEPASGFDWLHQCGDVRHQQPDEEDSCFIQAGSLCLTHPSTGDLIRPQNPWLFFFLSK